MSRFYSFLLIAVLCASALDHVFAKQKHRPGSRKRRAPPKQQGRPQGRPQGPPQGRPNPQQQQRQQMLMQQAAIRRDVAAKLWCKDESIKQMCNLKTLTTEGAPGMDGACFHAISTEDRGEALAPCGMCDPPVSSAETVCKQCSDVVRQLVTFCQENDKNKLPDFYEGL